MYDRDDDHDGDYYEGMDTEEDESECQEYDDEYVRQHRLTGQQLGIVTGVPNV